MSEEFDPASEPKYTSFWPVLILLAGLLVWLGFQDFSMNTQRSSDVATHAKLKSALDEADQHRARFNVLVDDLYKTAQKDEAAKPIARAAIQAGLQAGLIHVQAGAPGAGAVQPPPPK